MPWKCLLLTKTDRGKTKLRRYTFVDDSACPHNKAWGHQAITPMPDVDLKYNEKGYITNSIDFNLVSPNLVWPEKCSCGYVFKETDGKTYDVDQLFLIQDGNGRLTTLREAPIGSMWDAHWMHDWDLYCRDGISLHVKLPGGSDWCIDGPSQQTPKSKGWSRTGTAPNITASPSIHHPGVYHGWLANGLLSDDIDGKKF